MSLLNEFSARWPRQDKQSAAGRKMAESSGTFQRGRPRAARQCYSRKTPPNTLIPFRKLRSNRGFLLQFSVLEQRADKAGKQMATLNVAHGKIKETASKPRIQVGKIRCMDSWTDKPTDTVNC